MDIRWKWHHLILKFSTDFEDRDGGNAWCLNELFCSSLHFFFFFLVFTSKSKLKYLAQKKNKNYAVDHHKEWITHFFGHKCQTCIKTYHDKAKEWRQAPFGGMYELSDPSLHLLAVTWFSLWKKCEILRNWKPYWRT